MSIKTEQATTIQSCPPATQQYFSGPAIATHMGISRTTQWRLSKLPGHPGPVRLGRSVRWELSAVVAFVQSGAAGGAA